MYQDSVFLGELKCERVNPSIFMPRLILSKAQDNAKIFENHLNPIMLVFIG